MKSVLISIQPKWVEKIASGEKTIEVRKTRPRWETPLKCYIYETKGYDTLFGEGKPKKLCVGGGRVIGEFLCDNIEDYTYSRWGYCDSVSEKSLAQTCLTAKELCDYGKQKTLYAWHITDLKIYDKPKELSEFKRWNRTEENIPCAHTKWLFPDCKDCKACNLERPPQSWCYVESLGEEK